MVTFYHAIAQTLVALMPSMEDLKMCILFPQKYEQHVKFSILNRTVKSLWVLNFGKAYTLGLRCFLIFHLFAGSNSIRKTMPAHYESGLVKFNFHNDNLEYEFLGSKMNWPLALCSEYLEVCCSLCGKVLINTPTPSSKGNLHFKVYSFSGCVYFEL